MPMDSDVKPKIFANAQLATIIQQAFNKIISLGTFFLSHFI